MRPALRWAAAGTVVATIGAAWLPEDPALPAAVTAHAQGLPQPSRAPAAPDAGEPPTPVLATPPAPQVAIQAKRAPWPALRPTEQAAWLPPPPPPPPPRALPAPVEVPAPAPPPAFTYKWLGQLVEDGKTRVFLAGPQRMEVLAVGQTLPEGWRIEGVQDGQLQLTWLATGATVSVAARP
jgi:hypothetical protein